MKDLARCNAGDVIAALGACIESFGDWHYVLAFNLLLVAIACDGYERGHERGYEDGLLEGPPWHMCAPSGWVPGQGQEVL